MRLARAVPSLILAAMSASCGGERRPNEYVYRVPPALGDSLRVADATTVGIDSSRIGALIRPFLAGNHGKHTSFLVMKDGRLIIEEYFGAGSRERRNGVQSVSKSVTSLLVGYAKQQGIIRGVDDPIAMYLPKYRSLLTDGKERITIRHLLTMTSGLEWNEQVPPYGEGDNVRELERNSADPVAFVLGRRLISQPGETFAYNGGGMTILGAIMRHASQLPADTLVARAFKGLLDGGEIAPSFQNDSVLNAAGGFSITSRGMAKIGQMILDGGRWNGAEVFDPGWIRESTDAAVTRTGFGYGYLWWRWPIVVGERRIGGILANGYGGQRILVIPDLKIVMVATAENYARETPIDSLVGPMLSVLGPFRVNTGRLVTSTEFDSAWAYPRERFVWTEIMNQANPSNDGAQVRISIDTASAKRLADGSYLLWMQSQFGKPIPEAGRPYNRLLTRLILRCETRTDGRYKRVASTGYLDDGMPVFQDTVGMAAAQAQLWVAAWEGSLDLTVDRRVCDRVAGRP